MFGAAWSPDGQQIVFTTDISGRSNLWKVRASGGWPIQLVQSDDRQYSAVWSPDGKWIVLPQDYAGNELLPTAFLFFYFPVVKGRGKRTKA